MAKTKTNRKRTLRRANRVKRAKVKVKAKAHPVKDKRISAKRMEQNRKRKSVRTAKKAKLRREEAVRVSQETEKAAQKVSVDSVIKAITKNDLATEFLRKNVSKNATEVITSLTEPKTDEQLAMELGVKINAIRRILNIMHGYGITNYNISKDSKGWLSFLWFINTNKIDQFYDYINKKNNVMNIIDENCNDYFVCKSCYNDNKLIFNFDSSFEAGFKCVVCGNKLQRISKDEAKVLLVR